MCLRCDFHNTLKEYPQKKNAILHKVDLIRQKTSHNKVKTTNLFKYSHNISYGDR